MATNTSMPPAKRLDLGAVFHAAEDDGDGKAHVAAIGAEALADLAGELACGGEHQNPGAAPGRGFRIGGEAL